MSVRWYQKVQLPPLVHVQMFINVRASFDELVGRLPHRQVASSHGAQ